MQLDWTLGKKYLCGNSSSSDFRIQYAIAPDSYGAT